MRTDPPPGPKCRSGNVVRVLQAFTCAKHVINRSQERRSGSRSDVVYDLRRHEFVLAVAISASPVPISDAGTSGTQSARSEQHISCIIGQKIITYVLEG